MSTRIRHSKINFTGFPKISILFILLIFVVIFNAIFNIYFIQKEKSNLEIINDQINPVNVNLNQLQFLIVRSKMYATNWVYLQAEEESKRNLNKLISEDYPNLKNALIAQFNFSKVFFQKATQDSINHIFNSCEVLFHYQRLIMGKLQDFSDYNNPTKKFESEELIESEVLPRAKILQDLVNRFVIFNRSVSVNYIKEIKNDSDKIMQILFLMSFLMIIFVLASVYFIYSNINRPVQYMRAIVEDISKGELKPVPLFAENTVIGDMSVALNQLSNSFLQTADFANQIENGNLDVQYEKLSDRDQLGVALISMQKSLRNYSRNLELQISERTAEVVEKGKKIEELKSFYESILANIPLDILILNEKRKYLFVNTVAVKDPEIRNEMMGKDDFELSDLFQNKNGFAINRANYFNEAFSSGHAIEYEQMVLDENGKETWKLHRFYPVITNGNFNYMIEYGMDITVKKLQEIKINDSLEEKGALLGEIHHRVKNNLTLVLGLIEMQIERQQDMAIKTQYSEIKNRIYAMSLIHDKMYKSSSFANIDMQDYLKDLVNSISKFNLKNKPVKISFDIDEISVKNKDAVPIALLVNEIVTNAFKYAFSSDDKIGKLQVRFNKEQEGYRLLIKDNGPGIPEGFDVSKSSSLGFKLINIFTRQLKGKLNYFNQDGLNFDVFFKL